MVVLYGQGVPAETPSPSNAMAMAMSDSVTVSMGLGTIGVFKEIFFVKPQRLKEMTGATARDVSGNWVLSMFFPMFPMDLKPRDENSGSLAAIGDDLVRAN